MLFKSPAQLPPASKMVPVSDNDMGAAIAEEVRQIAPKVTAEAVFLIEHFMLALYSKEGIQNFIAS
jgi:hypothetical protein